MSEDMTMIGRVGEMTKGPWQQHDNAAPYGQSYAATVWGPKGPGYGLVADCRHGIGAKAELIANAKAIAALPELIAALRGLMSWRMRDGSPCMCPTGENEDEPKGTMSHRHSTACQDAREALKKAGCL